MRYSWRPDGSILGSIRPQERKSPLAVIKHTFILYSTLSPHAFWPLYSGPIKIALHHLDLRSESSSSKAKAMGPKGLKCGY